MAPSTDVHAIKNIDRKHESLDGRNHESQKKERGAPARCIESRSDLAPSPPECSKHHPHDNHQSDYEPERHSLLVTFAESRMTAEYINSMTDNAGMCIHMI